MDKLKNYIIISLVILILLGLCTLFGYLYYNEKNKPANQIISTITEVQIDTIQFTDSLFYPVPVIVEKPVFDSIIDTVYVINDYYTGKIYEYNFKDTNIKFHAGIMIHKNALVSFIPEYEIYRKTITITNNIESVKPPKFSLSIGADIGAIFDSTKVKPLLFITASIQQNKSIYEAGYDPFNKAAKVGFKYTIIYK